MDFSKSRMYGFERVDFSVEGTDSMGFVAFPAESARRSDSSWLWYAPTFIDKGPYQLPKALHEYYLSAALAAGVCVAGVDVGESWGAPYGREIFCKFYNQVTAEFKLNKKVCLMPQSRGGLMCYNWAAENPQCVKAIGAIYPVCEATRAERLDKLSNAYGISGEQILAEKHLHHPIDRIEPLVKAGVIIQHIHGQVDDVVPYETNSQELVEKYKSLGGAAALISIPDKGHEEVEEFFRNEAMKEFFANAGDELTA